MSGLAVQERTSLLGPDSIGLVGLVSFRLVARIETYVHEQTNITISVTSYLACRDQLVQHTVQSRKSLSSQASGQDMSS
jgi:hypothetical protein